MDTIDKPQAMEQQVKAWLIAIRVFRVDEDRNQLARFSPDCRLDLATMAFAVVIEIFVADEVAKLTADCTEYCCLMP
jgi:hypothetical protein